jgi:prepilin-type N-terminal cleavage/methylation domain-containing protein
MNLLLKQSKRSDRKRGDARGGWAFTLIELLVVIAIIGILAGLLIPLAGIATTKMRISRVKAELSSYVNAIETYKMETGEYPPDNGLMQNINPTPTNEYKTRLALNPLYYELTGAIFTNQGGAARYKLVADGTEVTVNDLTQAFNVNGLRNSARLRNNIDYKGFTVKKAQAAELSPTAVNNAQGIRVLAVPVPGPFTLEGVNKMKVNPWFYDSSSTNRNNKNSFDLWAEIEVGGKVQIIGNWKN